MGASRASSSPQAGSYPARFDLAGLVRALRAVASAPTHARSADLVGSAREDLRPLAESDVAYAALPLRARRLLRRLAVAPALPDDGPAAAVGQRTDGQVALCPVDLATMAALTRRPTRWVRRARNELGDAGFLGPILPGNRRAVHPLHAPLARLHLFRDESRSARSRRALRGDEESAGQMRTLLYLGLAAETLDGPGAGTAYWQRAEEMARSIDDPEARAAIRQCLP